MYTYTLISTILSLSSLSLSSSLPATPPSTLLNINKPNTLTVAHTNSTPSHEYYQSSSPNALPSFVLLSMWDPPETEPKWHRPTQPGAGVQLLAYIMRESVAQLPPEDPVGKDYLTFGPEVRPSLNYLDTRIAVRQYREGDWQGVDWPEARLRNKELAAAAGIGGDMFGRKAVSSEIALRMCYLGEHRNVDRCVGTVMVQRDLWVRR